MKCKWYAEFISIHSPHTRGDTRDGATTPADGISIRSPHARGDIVWNKK